MLDTSDALPLVIAALTETRERLERAGVLGTDAWSSSRFLFRLIGTRALESCAKKGLPTGACMYAKAQALWAQQGLGKPGLDATVAFSRWVRALGNAGRSNGEGVCVHRTAFGAGTYEISVWLFRPSDRGRARDVRLAGVSIRIERDGHDVSIQTNDDATIPETTERYFNLPEALETAETDVNPDIGRVLENVRTALLGLPVRTVRLLAENPNRLTNIELMEWWTKLAIAAKNAAAFAGVLVLTSFLTFCALPERLQEKIFFGFAYKVRKAFWTADRPHIYYGPRRVELRSLHSKLGTISPGTTVHDAVTDTRLTVERVGTDPYWLRFRLECAPQFRTNRTKYYIDFGDPAADLPGYDMVTLGPAAVVEHRYAGPGTYTIVIPVAVDALTSEQREGVPVDFQIDESWGWVQYRLVSAEVVLTAP